MKLILLHGNFQIAVLQKAAQIKKEFDPLSISEIADSGPGFNLSSPSLFSEKRLVILENPDIKVVEKIIEEKSIDLTILIKFSKHLEKSSAVLKKILENKGEVFNFEESAQISIFPFLDMLGTKNRNAFKEFEKNYSQYGGQYLITMLAYFLRRMIQRSKTSSDFMSQKIESQKRNFNQERIKSLYSEIIETDFKIKQGLIEEKLGVTLLVQKILN